MIVDSADLKNDLGKYLRLSAGEEIIITTNGRKVARLMGYEDRDKAGASDWCVREQAYVYEIAPRKASYQEYLELTETSEERYEYIDGEIYLLASPRVAHQKVLAELFSIFHNWFRGNKCRPMFAPFDITLRRWVDDINVVQPDLMVICDLEENLNEKDYYIGVPTLVAEIISESTRRKDLIKKLDLYMSTGVREYWTVNPLNREVCVYLFTENDICKTATYKNQETALSFHFSGLAVSLDIIFA
ncbi:MAG: type II toxin-antitoxin system prevent-host-death family antitoxin [Peptococcaceae bacterium]|nr:type II toxin-antitoxin system prevent-host-death family antitoxin [Peptococcaceae bacterium]